MSKPAQQPAAKEAPTDEVDWYELLRGEDDEGISLGDPLADYVLATPRVIAILNLCDCKEQLERWQHEPLRLAQAAKSAHLAMQAALTDALAGSTGIGAYRDKDISKWLEYFEASRTGDQRRPQRGHVMAFGELLDKATRQPLPWTGQKLEVTADENEQLKKLTHVRHRMEHPHPESHYIEPRFICQTLPVAARLSERLLEECSHHSQDGEREKVRAMVVAIDKLCTDIEEKSP